MEMPLSKMHPAAAGNAHAPVGVCGNHETDRASSRVVARRGAGDAGRPLGEGRRRDWPRQRARPVRQRAAHASGARGRRGGACNGAGVRAVNATRAMFKRVFQKDGQPVRCFAQAETGKSGSADATRMAETHTALARTNLTG